jgi:transcription initiation factor TFIID TATA-box-binding protein
MRRRIEQEKKSIETANEIKAEWRVENVVATATTNTTIMLVEVARKYPDCEYNPERFPGLVMRNAEPKSTVLLFSTGKMVITGLRDENDVEKAVNVVIDRLKKAKIEIKGTPEFIVQNVVASGDLHVPIDLNEATMVLDNAMYEPEVFPGLVFRMTEPKTVFLIFSTGKIVCTGAKSRAFVAKAVENLAKIIADSGLSKPFDEADASDANIDDDIDDDMF